jgi:hypothetical protein
MGRKDQRGEERRILDYVGARFPAFLNGAVVQAADADPPDFLATCSDGGKIGLELTSWLNSDQVREGRGRECMRGDLLKAIDEQNHSRPKNFGFAVIMPQWGAKIKKDDYQGLCTEFHSAVQEIDARWKALRRKHWRPLRAEERFDYETYLTDLEGYSTLRRYVSSIWFAEAIETNATRIEESWVSVEQDGALYNRMWSIQALKTAIEAKFDLYEKPNTKAHLEAQNLDKFYLLVHTDPDRSSYNTPYQTFHQMRISPIEGLAEVARFATGSLNSRCPKVVDAVFLLYHLRNASWLAQIWPTFEQVPAETR